MHMVHLFHDCTGIIEQLRYEHHFNKLCWANIPNDTIKPRPKIYEEFLSNMGMMVAN